MSELIKMVRHKAGFTAPYAADVHPKEVAEFAAAGWVKQNTPKSAGRARTETDVERSGGAGDPAPPASRPVKKQTRSKKRAKTA